MKSTGLYLICILNIAFIIDLMAYGPSEAAELKTIEFLGLASTLPPAWIEQKPSSSMRLAQFRVPGVESEGDANLILYYFGQGQGGSTEANIARWKSQFSSPGGGAVEPSVATMQVNNMPVTIVELRGDYARGAGMGPAGTAALDQILLASIVEAPRGTLTHNYWSNPDGVITKANLIVATNHNLGAIEVGLKQMAVNVFEKGIVSELKLPEPMVKT